MAKINTFNIFVRKVPPPPPDPCTLINDSLTEVKINGVTWSTRNVNSPGTFTSSTFQKGMFYQFNRNLGWSNADPKVASNGSTIWNKTAPTPNILWATANDPSPTGWRVPTFNQINTLLVTSVVSHRQVTCNGVSGVIFTEIATQNAVFFPLTGERIDNSIYGSDESRRGVLSAYLSCFYYSNQYRGAMGDFYEALRLPSADTGPGWQNDANPIRPVKA
jgi:hypothetical protein